MCAFCKYICMWISLTELISFSNANDSVIEHLVCFQVFVQNVTTDSFNEIMNLFDFEQGTNTTHNVS